MNSGGQTAGTARSLKEKRARGGWLGKGPRTTQDIYSRGIRGEVVTVLGGQERGKSGRRELGGNVSPHRWNYFF